jgi:hypothetical protein
MSFRIAAVVTGLLMVSLAQSAAHASPAVSLNRKPGLWLVEISSDGKSAGATSKQCIDASTDVQMLRLASESGAQACSKNELTKELGGYAFYAECTMFGSAMVSRGEFQGDFDSKYTGEINTTFTPPLYGKASNKTRITATWKGPCPSSMKPGDMTLPNGRKFNLEQAQMGAKMASEAMSNPALAKMLQGAMENMPGLQQAIKQQLGTAE